MADDRRQVSHEMASGERFAFGENWRRFLRTVDEDRIVEAERSLRTMLGVEDLEGRRFLDAGCGSGLFSLAAHRLGAVVHSFDYDPASVDCAKELRRRFAGQAGTWSIEEGSVLEEAYLRRLGTFDVVYSWGVLHHTGGMWRALELVTGCVAPGGGRLFIAIYNDQGYRSRIWRAVKRAYCGARAPLRVSILAVVGGGLIAATMVRDTVRLQPLGLWRQYRRQRGMSAWHDVVDWVGGYPFEVATPAAVAEFCGKHGLILEKVTTTRSLGNNQFVFRRPDDRVTA
jgi:2-polyprenyl-3-methyl-5-hydroxy-6-metoxy-1,4-benzoquinol methylase